MSFKTYKQLYAREKSFMNIKLLKGKNSDELPLFFRVQIYFEAKEKNRYLFELTGGNDNKQGRVYLTRPKMSPVNWPLLILIRK